MRMNILNPHPRGAAAKSISPVTARDPSSRRGVAPGVLFSQQPQNGFALSIGETRIGRRFSRWMNLSITDLLPLGIRKLTSTLTLD